MDTTKDAASSAVATKKDQYETLNEGRVNIMDSDSRCGCGPFKPGWLQFFAGPKLFTVHMGSILAIHFGMSSYMSGILTTIERQFELSSSESGGLTIANDVAILCLVIIVSYYGHSSHRPRWIAGGGLIIALGLLLCTLPHFISDPIDPRSIIIGGSGRGHLSKGALRGGVCNAAQRVQIDDTAGYNQSQVASDVAQTFGRYNGSACTEDETRGSSLVKWLVIGQIIVGVGAAPMFPLVISYIDDSVRKHELTSYTAVLFIMATLGPMAGYMLSSKATSLYVDFDRVNPDLIPDIPQYDPRWIGAWWLGFLVCSAALVILSIPMFLYPKQMPVPNKVEGNLQSDTKSENNNMEAITDGIFKNRDDKDAGFVDGMKNVIITVKRLCLNVALIIMILGGSAEMASSIIGRTFGVKYMISQFSASPKDATILTGGILIPCIVVGQVISAFICRRFKLDTKQCVIFIIVSLCLSLVTVPIKMFVGCPNSPVAGVNVPYSIDATSPIEVVLSTENTEFKQSNLEATCNADCHCPDEIFRPVCGDDGVTYISPCHAGCEMIATQANSTINTNSSRSFTTKKIYKQCKCVAGMDGISDTAASGLCRTNCDTNRKLLVYMVLGALSVFFMSLTHNPITFITLRIVNASDRSVAIGLKSLLNKCLAFFPAPVYMGAIINYTCIYWQRTCGERGSCWLYDLVALRFAFFGTIIALQFVGILCYGAMYVSIARKQDTNIKKLNDDVTEATEATKFEVLAEDNSKDIATKF